MTDKMRSEFEAAVRERFEGIYEQTFLRTPDGVYYSSVHSRTFQGRVQPEYAPVQMLWEMYHLARQSTDAQDEAWIAEHSHLMNSECASLTFMADPDDVREYLRSRNG